jgi:3-oxoacyl-[acyl-carrier-protein] synthase-3
MAGVMALAFGRIPRDEIGLLLLATSTPDHLLPPTAPLVAHRLGLTRAGGIDMAGACAGFIYALTLADNFVRSSGKPVLVIAANILSRRINPSERASCVLFSDAAGAVLLAPTSRNAGVAGAHLMAKGDGYGLISIPAGGSRKPFSKGTEPGELLMAMDDGQAVYAAAVAMMRDAAQSALKQAGLAPANVTHFIPHQANARMMATVAHQLSIAPERTLSTVAQFGNSSAATIPFTLSMLANERRYQENDIVMMTAAGAGMIGGAAVLRW